MGLTEKIQDAIDLKTQIITLEYIPKYNFFLFLNNLKDKRQIDIIQKRFLSEKQMTLAEIGIQYNLSRERIRQLQDKALRRLKPYRRKMVLSIPTKEAIEIVKKFSKPVKKIKKRKYWFKVRSEKKQQKRKIRHQTYCRDCLIKIPNSYRTRCQSCHEKNKTLVI